MSEAQAQAQARPREERGGPDVEPGGAASPEMAAWEERIRGILAARRGLSWDLVDAVGEGAARFPAVTAREAAERLGISAGNFSCFSRMSRTYPPFTRVNGVGISVYREGLGLGEADRARLIEAAAGGLTWREARAYARELRGEAERARLRAEVEQLRRRLAAAEADPGDLMRRSTRRVRDAARVAVGAYRDLADVVAQVCDQPGVGALHGNARRGLATAIRRDVDRVAAACDSVLEQRIRPAVDRVGGAR